MSHWITYLKHRNKIFAFIAKSYVVVFFSNINGLTVVCIYYMFTFHISFLVWYKAFWLSNQLWITYIILCFSFILKLFIEMLFNISRPTVAWFETLIKQLVLFYLKYNIINLTLQTFIFFLFNGWFFTWYIVWETDLIIIAYLIFPIIFFYINHLEFEFKIILQFI